MKSVLYCSLSLNQELTNSVILTGQRVPGIFLSSFPNTVILWAQVTWLAFYMCAGEIHTQGLMLAQQPLY